MKPRFPAVKVALKVGALMFGENSVDVAVSVAAETVLANAERHRADPGRGHGGRRGGEIGGGNRA